MLVDIGGCKIRQIVGYYQTTTFDSEGTQAAFPPSVEILVAEAGVTDGSPSLISPRGICSTEHIATCPTMRRALCQGDDMKMTMT